jgi:hypothetical protein
MAFCLMVVFGYMRKTQRKRIKLYNKLGGQFVGYLTVPDKSLSLWQQVVDLKKQAAKLCPDNPQSYVDILLYVGNTQLYIWFSDFEQVKAIQHATTMQMMWDQSHHKMINNKLYIPIPFY